MELDRKRKATGYAGTSSRGVKKVKLMKTTKTRTPKVKNVDRSILVKHKEYIQPINASSAYLDDEFSINPGLQQVFPWLSTVAQNFESYEFKSLKFKFKSICGGEPTSISNIGAVIMFPQYNVVQQTPTSKQAAESFHDCVSGKPTRNMVCTLKGNMMKSRRYVRTERDQTQNQVDMRLYDLCKFVVATQDNPPGGVTLGELWVEYEVQLFNPRVPTAPNDNPEYWQWTIDKSDSTVSGTCPMGTVNRLPDNVPGMSIDNRLNLNLDQSTSYSTLNIDGGLTGYIGILYICYGGTGTATNVAAPSITVSANTGITANTYGTPTSQYYNSGTSNQLIWYGIFKVAQVTTASKYFRFGNAQLPSGWTSVLLQVNKIGLL